MAEMRPTPRPAKNLPATNIAWLPDATVCRMTPRLNTIRQLLMMPHRRPKLSATGAAKRAPKKVPAERIETMRDSCEAVMVPLFPVENESCQLLGVLLVEGDLSRPGMCC